MLGIFVLSVGVTPVFSADRSASEDSGSKGTQGLKIPGNTPQTGDEILARKDAELLRGKLLKMSDELYTVETSPGTQTSVRTGTNTKYEGNYKGMEGDWVEILVTPDQHIQALKRSTPAYTVEGTVLTVDNEFFVVKDSAGKEIRLNIGNDMKFQGAHKVGDRIRAEFSPEGKALSIKPAIPPVGPPGA
jgi:hypothetical protein